MNIVAHQLHQYIIVVSGHFITNLRRELILLFCSISRGAICEAVSKELVSALGLCFVFVSWLYRACVRAHGEIMHIWKGPGMGHSCLGTAGPFL